MKLRDIVMTVKHKRKLKRTSLLISFPAVVMPLHVHMYIHTHNNHVVTCTHTHTLSALPKIVTNGYKALNLQYFFTCGHDEVRAWTIMVRLLAVQSH